MARPLLFLLTFALGPTLDAQEILVQEGFSGSLYSVDPKTGESRYIATPPLGAGNFWNALAFDSQGKLYAGNGDDGYGWDIYEIDPDTAQTTFLTYVQTAGLNCMAFDANDTLYFINDIGGALVGPQELHTLDLATGISTLIGDTGYTEGMVSLDFHDGILYAYPFGIGLVTIDTNTGVATDINPSYGGIITSWTQSMCFDEQGALYYLDAYLWTIDTETTAGHLVDKVPPYLLWGECEFREGPTPNFSLTLSGFANNPMKIKIAGATPFGQVAIAAAYGPGGPTTIPAGFPCAGLDLALNSNLRLLGIGIADQDGYLELGPDPMPAAALQQLRIQAVDLSSCDTSNKAIVSF